jgi:hypothetical protein
MNSPLAGSPKTGQLDIRNLLIWQAKPPPMAGANAWTPDVFIFCY